MKSRLKPRVQGDLGELSAMEWLTKQGAIVAKPVFHSPFWDLVADLGDRILRVEVKTTTYQNPRGRWCATISTSGGNQSWTGVVKYLDPSACEYLFVHVGDGRRWFIPTGELECKSAVGLGGPKYSEFEVEPGRPLLPQRSLELNPDAGEYPSGQRTAAVNRQAQPSQVRILPPPSAIDGPALAGRAARTRISANHQVTIPSGPFRAAALEIGDRLRVAADAKGRVVMTRVDDVFNYQTNPLWAAETDSTK
jgi:hypothetical protein